MRKYDLMVQEVALLVQTDDLAAVAETRVYRHCPFLADRSGEKKLRKVLSKNIDRLYVSLFLSLLDDLIGQ